MHPSQTTSVLPAIATRRLIGRFSGAEEGPLLVCIGSLHGNEPAGAEALTRLCASVRETTPFLKRGDFVALAGNLAALQLRQRFVDADLNRHWTAKRIAALRTGQLNAGCAEDGEMLALLEELGVLAAQARGPIHLIDLHTTSGESPPFATVGQREKNLAFALRFGVPTILGLQEGLEGTLLDHIESRGWTCMGFEGGRHTDPAAVDAAESLAWIALDELGLLNELDESRRRIAEARERLARLTPELPPLFEVRYRYAIDEQSRFRMERGWASFEPVEKGRLLASENGDSVRASSSGRLLMPLYQQQGEDGFFLMQEYVSWRQKLCRLLTKLPAHRILPLLPGVRLDPNRQEALLVDRRFTEGPAVELLLALGYRSWQQIGEETRVFRRQRRRPARLERRAVLPS